MTEQSQPQDHVGSKPCTICSTPRDVLVRCQIDDTGKWHFVCPGKCWKDVSGGSIDGDAQHPYYRYGGMWKNKHEAVSAKKKKKGKKGRTKSGQDVKPWSAAREDTVEIAVDAYKEGDGTASGTASSDEEEHGSLAPVTRYSDIKYTRNDRVSYDGKLYVCRKSHWADPKNPPPKDIHLWEDKGDLPAAG